MATLSLTPSNLDLSKNETAIVQIYLDPGGAKIIGTDLILNYDSQKLEIVEVNSLNVFQNVSGQKSAPNKYYFSLSDSYNSYVTAPGTIAEIKLRAKDAAGATNLMFDYTANSTTDTNVVAPGGKDVLTTINNLSLNINASPSEVSTSQTSVLPTTKFLSPLPRDETKVPAQTQTTAPEKFIPEVLGAATQPVTVTFSPLLPLAIFLCFLGTFVFFWQLRLALGAEEGAATTDS